ncbi:MAG: elongation factor G [Chloroflexi bacterium]|nr:elongation factor G [Chloroflexota bacterium]
MANYTTEQIRNVVLLSHSGAGKTSLTEAMLFSAGVINRLGRVEEGTTVSDYDPDSIKRRISINLSLLPCPWNGSKINMIDTPGYPDFLGEVKAGIRVADAAVTVVCAASGVEVGTELSWGHAEEAKLPRLVLVNKMDRENADFARVLAEIQKKLGKKCVAIQVPIGAQQEFQGVVDIIAMKAYMASKGEEREVPSGVKAQADSLREKLVEAVSDVSDEIMAKYLDGKEVTSEEIRTALKRAVAAGAIVPVLVGSGLQNVGVSLLFRNIIDYLPSPAAMTYKTTDLQSKSEIDVKADPSAPLSALVFKTSADPYVGKLTYFRVYSGMISSNSQVFNSTKNAQERIGQLFLVRGKTQETVPQVIAGDIGGVAKLAATSTNDTLSTKERPLSLAAIKFPPPAYGAAIYPKTKADLDKLGLVLPRLVEEDPTLHVRREMDTAETILWGLGETQIEVVADRMQRKFGVEIRREIPRVPYKETVTAKVQAEYRHKKQTGGHGQFGHVWLELEPLKRESGFEFTERIVGGVIPKNYIPGVEKGVMEAKQEGVLAGFPVVDVRATLFDGSFHPVDSSDMSFKIAGLQAFKKGMAEADPVLLEPVMKIKVTVPDNYTGDIISDLNTKRGRVLGVSPQGGISVIEAMAPLAEVQRYAADLRSITQGRGVYSMEFDHYEEVPSFITQKIVEARRAEKAAEKA